MKKTNALFWPVVALVILLALFAVLVIGGRSVAGRAYDLAVMKANSPYYQTLDLHAQVVDGGRADGRLLWVLGLGLAVVAVVALMIAGARFLREARLSVKAVRRPARSAGYAGGSDLPALPRAPILPARQLPAWTAEDGDYSENDGVDASAAPTVRAPGTAPADRAMRPIVRWSGGR